MAIRIELELVRTLAEKPGSLASAAAESPGFAMYWRNLGRDFGQAVAELSAPGFDSRLTAALAANSDGKNCLAALSRLSGASIEQQVSRHLPDDGAIDAWVEFIPGGDSPLVTEGNAVAVNIFALELRGNKLFVGDFPLLSLLANRIHRLCSAQLAALPAAANGALAVFLARMFQESCATLFFTVPVFGPMRTQWQEAELRREADVELLRRYLHGQERSAASAWELEEYFALQGSAALAAKYPLATWMCQVIEGAFGRPHLVGLLRRSTDFVRTFEEARVKFGLPEKYSLAVF